MRILPNKKLKEKNFGTVLRFDMVLVSCAATPKSPAHVIKNITSTMDKRQLHIVKSNKTKKVISLY